MDSLTRSTCSNRVEGVGGFAEQEGWVKQHKGATVATAEGGPAVTDTAIGRRGKVPMSAQADVAQVSRQTRC
jgi:hypothetical protein